MSAKIILIFCSFLAGYANSASTYDQRQNGNLNVQVDLKDLRIIAVMKGGKEEYVDYDYAYDYSEMTIKPVNGTTPKPLNGTSTTTDPTRDNTTAVTAVTEPTNLAVKNNDTNSLETDVTLNPANESMTTVKSPEMITSATIEPQEAVTKEMSTSTSTTRPTPGAGCKKGFVMNQKGDCELKLQDY
ncbi:uncharacterized protein LOC126367925 isoform X2 [Pectinophora gossypiella]|uniref:uncharacterized protein LOC126367925 isoform X2 n=1 Tax=Pectinophora gossypiella TaxID=13191 RepID=UPI00214E15FD|nr:uncharacterized protein LOC126367925 isoform X2 [Pectinophora gossypiella]